MSDSAKTVGSAADTDTAVTGVLLGLSTCSPRWSAEGEGLGQTRHRAPTCPSRPRWPSRVCGAHRRLTAPSGHPPICDGWSLGPAGPIEGSAAELEPANWRCDVANRI